MIKILHAFSRRNAGDGLLVDLTLALLADAGIPSHQCQVLALDAASFADLDGVRQVPGEARGRLSLDAVGALAELTLASGRRVIDRAVRNSDLQLGRLAQLCADARGFVAVGGGYLVADSPVRMAGVMLNHLPQILTAGRGPAPSVYLPQSIGPLHQPVATVMRRALADIDVLYARDDDTHAELHGVTDVRRCPDLAVLELAQRLPETSAASCTAPVVIVPRELGRAPGYVDRLRALAGNVARFAVQADVDGPRSDRQFLQRNDFSDAGDLGAVLQQTERGVVVSVRLHGAIGALLAGWPSIHLAYERKGWGAYQDLGLSEWVHDARTFDPAVVRRQVEALAKDARPMFDAIRHKRGVLIDARQQLVAELRQRFHG